MHSYSERHVLETITTADTIIAAAILTKGAAKITTDKRGSRKTWKQNKTEREQKVPPWHARPFLTIALLSYRFQ